MIYTVRIRLRSMIYTVGIQWFNDTVHIPCGQWMIYTVHISSFQWYTEYIYSAFSDKHSIHTVLSVIYILHIPCGQWYNLYMYRVFSAIHNTNTAVHTQCVQWYTQNTKSAFSDIRRTHTSVFSDKLSIYMCSIIHPVLAQCVRHSNCSYSQCTQLRTLTGLFQLRELTHLTQLELTGLLMFGDQCLLESFHGSVN